MTVALSDIQQALQMLFGYTDEELTQYQPLTEAVAAALSERGATKEEYGRLVIVAAARANYQIVLLQHGGDSVSSFQAGEVSTSESKGDAVSAAKAFLHAAEQQYSRLAATEGFAFRTV